VGVRQIKKETYGKILNAELLHLHSSSDIMRAIISKDVSISENRQYEWKI
jgi:hypothetical protein